MGTYSFKSVGCAIDGPGGNINLGYGAGVAEEGISVEPVGDRNTMTEGADGEVMHSLAAGEAGILRVRLLKTSITNARLMVMWNLQRASGASHGQNTISINDFQRGDVIQCTEVAFAREPTQTWAKVGAMTEWTFHAGHVHSQLGFGVPVTQDITTR